MVDFIGKVENVEGSVTVTHADGTTDTLQVGDAVAQGDIIETSGGGSIGVILADETTFSMGEEASITLDEMVYDPGTGEGSLAMSVTEGVFTFVSGSIAKTDPDAMTLDTPVATIGIRGTQTGIEIHPDGRTDVAIMEEGNGFVGEVVIQTDAGIQVLNQAQAFTTVINTMTPPSPVAIMDLNDLVSKFASTLNILPITDNNNANNYEEILLNLMDTAAGGESVLDGGNQVDLTAEGLADFETATGNDILSSDLADMTTASGAADTSISADGLADFDMAGTAIDAPASIATFETAAGSQIINTDILGKAGNLIDSMGLLDTMQVGNPVITPTSTPLPIPDNTPLPSDPVDVPVTPVIPVTPVTVVSTVVTEIVTTKTVVGNPSTTTTSTNNTTVTNDLVNHTETSTTTTSYVDTTNVDTTVTTTTTPVTTITYSDGTTNVTNGTPTVTANTTTETTVANRSESVDVINEPVITTSEIVNVNTVVADPVTNTTFVDAVTKENDLTANKEITTTTRTYTDTTTTDTTVTTTTTPVTTYTYSDGTVDVVQGTPTVDPVTTTDTTTATRDVVSINEALPTIVTTYEVNTVDVVSAEVLLNSTKTVNVAKANDLVNNREQVDTTTTTTNTYGTDTTTTTTTTAIHTLTYPDGTVEVERGTPTVTQNVVTSPREDIVTNTVVTYVQPTIAVTQEVAVNTVVSPEGLLTTSDNIVVKKANDLVNNREQVDTTTTTTNTYGTDTTVTTTTTDITTLTYPDGTVEVERGTPVDVVNVTTATRIEELPNTVITYNLPTSVTVDQVVVDTVVGTPATDTTFKDVVTKENDLTANKEITTTTRTYTDTTTTDTIVTTTTTPITTLTYPDGTVEVETGTSTVDAVTTTDTAVATREVISIDEVLPTIVTTYEVNTVDVVGAETLLTSVDAVAVAKANDLVNNREQVDTTTTTTNTYGTDTTTTTTTTAIHTLTYPDGTVEIERGTPVDVVNVTTATREDIIVDTVVTYNQPEIVVTQEVVVDTLVAPEALINTTDTVTVVKANDLENNREQVDTTTTTTNTYGTDTTVTTTTTPITTITYPDGTVEVERGTSTATADVTTETRVVEIPNTVTTYNEPTAVTVNEVTVNTVVGDPVTTTTFEDTTTRSNDLENNVEVLTATRTYTDTTTTTTTETTTTTPVTTLTYPDGTIEIERGISTISPVVSTDTTVDTRSDVILESTEQPQISITYNVVTDTVVGNEVLIDTVDAITVSKANDLENNREQVDTTTTTTSNFNTDTTTTTTTTPVYTITYSDGTVEVENGTPVVEVATTSEPRVAVVDNVVTTYNQPEIVVTEEVVVNSVVGNEVLTSSVDDVAVAKANDLENNREQVDTTTTTTNTYGTDTTTTTTTTQITTITYPNGQVEVERGTPGEVVDVTTATREEVLTDVVTTYNDPEIVVTQEVVVDTVIGDPSTTTTSEDTTTTSEGEDGSEVTNVVTEFTDTTTTDTTVTTTTTPITTITYPDGTVEVERGTSTIDPVTTTETTVATRIDGIDTDSTGTEDLAISLGIETVADNAVSVDISGVPTGAVLSAGTDNGDGSWTLNSDQLNGLTITPPDDYSGSFDLDVVATDANGATQSNTTTVEVAAVVDAPTLTGSAGNAVASEPTDYSNINFGENAGEGAGEDDDDEDDDDSGDDSDDNDSDDNDDSDDDDVDDSTSSDEIEGGKGDDVIFGGAGNDDIDGGKGDDIIFGGSGNNKIDGGKGDDIIAGNDGNDEIKGGSGDDVIISGGGHDDVDGGKGDDTLVFAGQRADYLVTEVEGKDGDFIIEHLHGGADGITLVENVETFQFANGQYGEADLLDTNPANIDTLTYDITIDPGLSDTDGSETLSDITVSNVPDGATFSAGTDNGNGSWTMTEADLNGLSVEVSHTVNQDFTFDVAVTSTETSTGEAFTTTASIDIVLPDETNIAGDQTIDALDPLSQMFTDEDTLTVDGKDYDISSLTDNDSKDDYGSVSPLGDKNGNDDYDAHDNDAGDGYESTVDGNDNIIDDIN